MPPQRWAATTRAASRYADELIEQTRRLASHHAGCPPRFAGGIPPFCETLTSTCQTLAIQAAHHILARIGPWSAASTGHCSNWGRKFPSERASCVMRAKLPPRAKSMAPNHPKDRVYPLSSSVYFIGRGGYFDPVKLQECPPGSVGTPAGEIWQFHGPKAGEYITQVTAAGPLGLEHRAIGDDSRRNARRRNQRFQTRRRSGHVP